MNYSLGEMRAYLAAIDRMHKESAAERLELGFVAAQASGQTVAKLVRLLRRD